MHVSTRGRALTALTLPRQFHSPTPPPPPPPLSLPVSALLASLCALCATGSIITAADIWRGRNHNTDVRFYALRGHIGGSRIVS